jgi:hypothetical protein
VKEFGRAIREERSVELVDHEDEDIRARHA